MYAPENGPMDPLSDLLLLLRPRSCRSGNLNAGGSWAFEFRNEQRAIMCLAVISGGCWLALNGPSASARLEAGDCIVLPSGRSFRLMSDKNMPPTDYKSRLPKESPGGVAQ